MSPYLAKIKSRYIYTNTKAVLEYCEAVWSGDGSGKNRYIKT